MSIGWANLHCQGGGRQEAHQGGPDKGGTICGRVSHGLSKRNDDKPVDCLRWILLLFDGFEGFGPSIAGPNA